MSIFQELKRRNVFRVAGAYAVTGWLIIEVAATLEDTLYLPGWVDTVIAVSLLLGFPIVLFLAWAFELTPEGLVRDEEVPEDAPSRNQAKGRLNLLIILVLTLALGYFVTDRFFLDRSPAVDRDVASRDSVSDSETSGPAQGDLSIAVLPFVNLSPDPDQAYFADGLTEELLNLLARMDSLKVSARTSSFYYKDKLDEIPLTEIARQLGVAHLLEGSVRRSGNQLRITAQLIEAGGGFHLWSQTWDRTLDDVFLIQDEISRAVADELYVTLLGAPPQARVVDTRALELTLQGRYLFNRRRTGDLAQALPLFEEAVAIDETTVNAWIGLVPLYLWLFDPPRIADARAAVDKAITLDPENPEAWIRQGSVLFEEGRQADAVASLERGLELGPDNPLALAINASMAMNKGDFDRGLAMLRHAVSTDPLHWVNRNFLGNTLIEARRLDEARKLLDESLALSQDPTLFAILHARVALLEGKPAEALEQVAFMPGPRPEAWGGDARLTYTAMAQHDLGNEPASRAASDEFLESYAQESPLEMAFIHAWRNELDEAFDWLDSAASMGLIRFDMAQIMNAPELDAVRADPRWDELLERLGAEDFSDGPG
jgi:TolB-like protein/Flp pilus assembly protein TadD